MSRWVIDTNVPVVANGVSTNASASCRLAASEALHNILGNRDLIFLDRAGEILAEYRRYCSPRGEPGVGDRFLQQVLQYRPDKVTYLDLAKTGDDYDAFPADPDLANFDRSDRKFAALAIVSAASVLNATDSDWLDSDVPLRRNGVTTVFVCGTQKDTWIE